MTIIDRQSQIRQNLAAVQATLEAACQKAGRNPQDVRLIGVTKYVDEDTTRLVAESGCLDLGESRPQALWSKAVALSTFPVSWHLIGHLQRNKVERSLTYVDWIHSLDSQRLLDQVIKDARNCPGDRPLRLLLELNVTLDDSKTGMSEDEATRLLTAWQKGADQRQNEGRAVEIAGLMGMASLDGNESQTRLEFERLRNLRDRFAMEFGLPLRELSMGMSGDFPWAIEHGSTMVRVGSLLFKGLSGS